MRLPDPEDMVRNTTEHDPTRPPRDPERSDAQLDMLHSFAAKLNVLTDTAEIGSAITSELRTIIDYHNCRVYLLQSDRSTLMPIAFSGEMTTEYFEEDLDTLITEIGEGITGTVAATRESLLTPDAREVPFSVTIEGTDDDLLESMLAVPMVAGDDVVGVIVLSSLGYAMFDDEDQRMLEVLAPHAAAAFQSARLLEAERGAAQAAGALLQLSQALTARHTLGDIFRDAIETIPTIIPCVASAAYVRDEATGDFRLAQLHAARRRTSLAPRADIADIPGVLARALFQSDSTPFVVPHEVADAGPARSIRSLDRFGDVLVCPLRWEPEQFGCPDRDRAHPAPSRSTTPRSRLARGVGDLTALALGNARRISELERFHRLVESLDAIFWEADADDLDLTFLGGRLDVLFADDEARWHRTRLGRPHRGRGPLARRCGGSARDRGGNRCQRRVPGPHVGGRHAVAARPRARRARSPGHAADPWLDHRHHGTQTGGTDASGIRAQVLGGVPSRARGGPAAARARRHEEHVPRGGLARPADPADLDPRIGADPRAEPPAAAAGRCARPRSPDRRQRTQARAPARRSPRPGSSRSAAS